MIDFENLLRQHEIKDEQSLKDYLELVSCSDYTDEYCEFHHILPKSMFYEFKNNPLNIVRLKYENHKKAHYLLSRIYDNDVMNIAYKMMMGIELNEREIWHKNQGLKGDLNPSKRTDVRKKISDSKMGVKRLDMKGKKYFGADDITIQNGLNQMKEKLKNTVVVKDLNGNRFRVSVDDKRYINGEFVSFNKNETRPNSASKNPKVMNKIMNSRKETYSKFENYSFDEIVEFLLKSHENGRNIFSKRMFSKNFSYYVKLTKIEPKSVYNEVIQRLSKSIGIEPMNLVEYIQANGNSKGLV